MCSLTSKVGIVSALANIQSMSETERKIRAREQENQRGKETDIICYRHREGGRKTEKQRGFVGIADSYDSFGCAKGHLHLSAIAVPVRQTERVGDGKIEWVDKG